MNASSFFQRTLRSSRRGFTLMEMLIVLTIIALLMGMVIYNISNLSGDANRTKAKADLLAFKEMLAAYQLDNGMLPTTDQGLKALWSKPTIDPIPPRWQKKLDQEVDDPWGHPYNYLNPGKHNPDNYDVWSTGDATTGDIGNWPDAQTTTTNQ